MKKLRLLFLLVTLLVALQQASATTSVDIANGAVTIDGTRKTYTQNDVTQGYDGVIVLTGTLESGATVVTISGGTKDAPVMIELDGLDAHATGDNCNGLCITSDAYVNITVSGTNIVRSGKDAAGLRLEEGSYLTIDTESTGSLSCYGGSQSDGYGGGAGIGANCGKGYGTLIINGGTIYAEGCKGGAGIGSGWESVTDDRRQGEITINGGYVKARGSWGRGGISCGEGIGSVNNTPAQVVVTGGVVDATVHEGSSLTDGNGNTLVSKWFDGLTSGQEVKVKPFDDYEGTLVVGEDGALSVIVPENRENNDVFLGKKVIQTSVSDKNRGSITSGGIYDVGTQLTLTVTLLQHNSVTGWSDDENNTDTERIITVSEDAKYVANLADLRDPITYDVLSEEDKTAYVSRFYYYMDYTDSDREKRVSVDIPETVKIEGKTYTVVQFGMEEYGTDDFRFNYMAKSYLTLPKTMKYIWLNPLRQVANMYLGMQLTFKGENAPKMLPEGSSNTDIHQVYVPYGAEEDYKAFAYMVTSRHTDLDIANGAIMVNGSEYTQGDVTGTIDETLVVTGINGDDLTRKITINGGTEDNPVRIAIKDLTIDLDASPDESGYMPINIEHGAWVDMIVQGTNTLKGGKDAAALRVAGKSEDGSEAVLNICQLSTGELNAYGGSTVYGLGGGAGIGANACDSYGTVIVNGGTIYAEGRKGGAGIGGGWEYGTGERTQGQLIFYGGTVTAVGSTGWSNGGYGYSCPEGIGSINGAAEVIFAGGTVNATLRDGTDSKTGIDVSKGVVTIDGTAKTYTQNGETKQYDGKLWLTGKLTADETIVTISGGTEDAPVMIELNGLDVTATGGGEQQIGGCKNGISISSGAYVNMTISGENVTRGGNEAAALRIPKGATLVIDESSTGSMSCYGINGGAGIGSNINDNYGTLAVNGGTIYTEGTGGGAGIGSGWMWEAHGDWVPGQIIINGGAVTAFGSFAYDDYFGTVWRYPCPDGIGSVNAPAEVIIAGGTVNASIRDGSVIKDGNGNLIVRRNFDGLTPGQVVDVSQYAPFGATVTVGENGVISVYVYEEATNDDIFLGKKIIKTYVSDAKRGSVTSGGIYEAGTQLTLTVTLLKHNSVTGWSDDENNKETTRTITVSEDAQYTVYLADLRDPITYDVLSEEDKTAYVSRFFYNSENTLEESMSIEIPETVEIDGETYTVVQFGMEECDLEDDFRFEPRNESSITMPKTMKYIWRNPFRWIAGMGILGALNFKSETAPEFLPEGETMFMHGKVYVPYGAEEAYGKIFREENVTSHRTDIDIADGAIIVNGSEYTQGDVTGTIDETLVISGERFVETNNNIIIAGGTEEQPVRVALKNVFITMGNTPGAVPVELADGAFVDMIIEGVNWLRAGESSAGLRVATTYGDDGTPLISTLNICQLSTGCLEAWGGSFSGIGGGAGIGGNINENPGNIFINAGEVFAEGCKGGAGIGGGWIRAKDKNTQCGRIAIYGGRVTALYYDDGDSEGISVGKPVGSANNYLLFYVSDNATFIGELKDNVVTTDADGNFSATATVYRGSIAGSEEEVSTATVLEDNAVAFTKSKALADYMDNVVLHGDLYDDYVYEGKTCRKLNLVEGKPFYAPEDFKAENVQFTINADENFVYADGTNGWHTLCLPFSGTFYADEEPVVPFAGLDDMNGTFWLKTFSGASSGNVLGFDFTTTVEAGKPYIYAIPGDKWGSEHSMKGKTISVRATDVTVSMERNDVKGSEYVFGGSFTGETKQGSVYVLNEDGNTFKWNSNGECSPFNAIVTAPLDETGAKITLVIGDVVPTGIRLPDGSIVGASQRDTHVYDVSGKRVGTMRPGNVYIKNNKKILKR